MGKINFKLENNNIKVTTFTLNDVNYIPNISCNILIITSLMSIGFNLYSNKEEMKLLNNNNVHQIYCTIKYKTENGYLPGIKMKPILQINT